MADIKPTAAAALARVGKKELQGKAAAQVQQITTDITTLDGPLALANAQVIQILRRALVRQRVIIQLLAKDLD